MNSLFFKNYMVTVCLVLCSVLLLSAVFVGLGSRYLTNEKTDRLHDNADSLAYSVEAYCEVGASLDSLAIKMVLSSMADSTGDHFFLCDAGGTVLRCSDMAMTCPHLGWHFDAQYLAEAQQTGCVSSLGGFYSLPHFVVAVPIRVRDSLQGYVFACADRSELVHFIARFTEVFCIGMLCVLILAVVISWLISRRMVRPLREMAAAAQQFAHGDFSARVRDDGREDEIGALTSAFNEMAASLQQSEQRRRDFIANVSHELKTPMTTISGFADGLLDGTIPEEAAQRYLTTISSESKRLNRMVRRMLDLSRLESAPVEEVRSKDFDLAETVRQTFVSFVDPIESKQLDVKLEIPEDEVRVLGEADAITQVVYNLLDNALKFAEVQSELGLSLWKQENKAYVSVRNHGPEIPAEELPRLFDRFHKADKSRSQDREGAGLGLYIVKTILNNHGEDITVTSRGGITEFVFSMTLKPIGRDLHVSGTHHP